MDIELGCAWRFAKEAPISEEDQLLALLQGIADTGSIASAARDLGLSYRHAWGRLQRWQTHFGQALLDATRGSGSQLSALALELLAIDARLRKRVSAELAAARDEMTKALTAGRRSGPVSMTIIASHDLALAGLRDLLCEAGHKVELHFRGSLESLSALAEDACDAAGFHCARGALGLRMWTQCRSYLKPRKHRLLRIARRMQGLIVRPGNPKRLRNVADLARPGIRFLNRQKGAGTRLVFDLILKDAGVRPEAIAGYAAEEYTHAAVAALIASGEADAGMGIEAAARRFGLDFLPMLEEDYWLAARADRLREAPVRALITTLASEAFAHICATLPGYQVSHAGEIVSIDVAQASSASASKTRVKTGHRAKRTTRRRPS